MCRSEAVSLVHFGRTSPVHIGRRCLVHIGRTSLVHYRTADDTTFHDVLALVRRQLWQQCILQAAAAAADLRFSPPAQLEHLLSAACY